jgi:NAD(P)-dependent dehydrogenase (short-subunit alcohol dehydrogenase family)
MRGATGQKGENGMSLTGKNVLVTGAGSGIGRAAADLFARRGAHVALIDIDPRVEAIAQAIRERGESAVAAVADISHADAVEKAVAVLAAAQGPASCLINNAGIVNNIAPLEKMTPEAWDREIGVNLTGAFNMIRSVVPGMKDRRWGRIVNISSGAARGGLVNQVAYAASKTGMLGLTHNVTLEYARHGITCNAILPGMIATEKVNAMPEEIKEAAMAMTPARRFGSVEEVAALIAFLCGEEAGFINGAEIDISGGGHLNVTSLSSRREARARGSAQ